MSIKTPQEYREKIAKTVKITLPSGLECVIRPVPTIKILELTDLAEIDKVSLDVYLKSHFSDALDAVIPSSVVSPKIVPTLPEGGKFDENVLYLDELVIGDLNYLFLEIVKISGIKKEDIESYQKFLAQPAGKKSGIDL